MYWENNSGRELKRGQWELKEEEREFNNRK
jgi:hypothetical protein